MIGRALCFAAAALAAASVAAHGQSQPPPYLPRVERPIVTTGEGAHRLPVDGPLLAAAAPFADVRGAGRMDASRPLAYGGLSDLRLFAADGREIGHLLVYRDAAEREWVSGAILPIAPTETAAKKTSGFEADLGAALPFDTIRVDGLPAPFLKPLVLEGSGDRRHWTLLAGDATLFDLPQERLRQVALAFAAGTYRYLRVSWDDTHSGRVPMPRAVAARRAGPAPSAPPLTMPLPFERRASEPGRSRYRVRLPAARLPIVALTLDVGGGHVFRTGTVSEARLTGGEAVPTEIGRGTIARITRSGATASQLRIDIVPPREPEVDLVVDDGNNPPLDLKGIAAEFAELPWIYFEAPGGAVVARYGDRRAAAPSYDLEAARASIRIAEVRDAEWGEPRETAPSAASAAPAPVPATGADIDPAGFRFQRALPEGAAGLVALTLDAAILARSRGPSGRFADVRIVDAGGKQVPYVIERREEPLALDLELNAYEPRARELGSGIGPRRSAYIVKLPYANLPSVRLVLETSARVFQRRVQAGVERPPDRRRRDTWFEVKAASAWQHTDEATAPPALALAIGSGIEGELVIVVDEGDNRPLPITAARALLPSYRLRFYQPAGPLRVVYGRDDLAAPQYDLALLAPQVMGAQAREIAASPPDAPSAAPAAKLLSPRTFWIGLGAAVLVLMAIIARLVRS